MINLTIMTGSTLAVVSLQFNGYNNPEKKIFYKKSSDADFTEWTTDRGNRSYYYPYTTQWEWLIQHWQLVIDELEPATSYDFYATVGNDRTSVATVSTDSLHNKCLYSIDSSDEAKASIMSEFAEDYFTIGQKVGFDSPFTHILRYSPGSETAASGYRGRINFGSDTVSEMAKKNVNSHITMLHESRHNLGLGSKIADYTDGKKLPMCDGQSGVPKGTNYFNNTVGCYEDGDFIYHSSLKSTVKSRVDDVYQFMVGSPLARVRMYGDHSNCPDYATGSKKADITLFFMLRALMFNKIDIITVHQQM